MISFRKRNNPSEEDEPLLVEDFSSDDKILIGSAKDTHNVPLEKRQAIFDDIVPIVVETDPGNKGLSGYDGDFMEFEAIDVLEDDDD